MRALAACLAVVMCVAACGSAGGSPPPVSVALDFDPNPNHSPIYLAASQGLDRRQGVRLAIVVPGSGPGTVQLLTAHRAQIGVLDLGDLALARLRGEPLVGIAALVQEPLAAIIAQPYIHRPRDLDGRRVGVSGLPSDPAFLRALMTHDGGSYATVKPVTIGFNAVAEMAAGNIAAVPAFWSDEGVALRLRGVRVNEFRVEAYGAPRYPEVVLVALRQTLARHGAEVTRALAAIAGGVRATEANPGLATTVIAAAAGSGDRRLIGAQVAALAPALLPPLRLDRAALQQWSAFAARTGLLPRALDVGQAFDFSIAPAALARAGLDAPPPARSG